MATTLTGNNFANRFADGASGVNNFDVQEANDVAILALGGNDTINLGFVTVSNYTIAASDGNDSIVLNSVVNSLIYGGAGNDTIGTGAVANSLVQSNSGGNNLFELGQVVVSSITTGAGNDTIDVGGLANSTIAAGAGDDSIVIAGGDVSDSIIYLGAGDDTFDGIDLIRSTIQSGGGDNNIDLVDLNQSSVVVGAGDDDIEVVDLESSTIAAGAGNDFIVVGDLVNSFVYLGSGEDTIEFGELTNSQVQSGSGNNLFVATDNDTSNGTITGGSGEDTLEFDGVFTDDFFGSNLVITSIENFVVADASDLTLGENAEALGINAVSSDSEDGSFTTIDASAYSDAISITGGAGNDTLFGGSGNDTITGGAGDDEITTGGGSDVLTGDGGADDFVITENFGATGIEITDFETGDDALFINLTATGAGADASTLSNLAFFRATSAAFAPSTTFVSAGGFNTNTRGIFAGAEFNLAFAVVSMALSNIATATAAADFRILFLDTAGNNQGLYVYEGNLAFVDGAVAATALNITATRVLATGAFEAADITFI